ncbi:hypothetical protein [Paraclostridium sordellii]
MDLDGNEYEMVGIFEGISNMTKSLKGLDIVMVLQK